MPGRSLKLDTEHGKALVAALRGKCDAAASEAKAKTCYVAATLVRSLAGQDKLHFGLLDASCRAGYWFACDELTNKCEDDKETCVGVKAFAAEACSATHAVAACARAARFRASGGAPDEAMALFAPVCPSRLPRLNREDCAGVYLDLLSRAGRDKEAEALARGLCKSSAATCEAVRGLLGDQPWALAMSAEGCAGLEAPDATEAALAKAPSCARHARRLFTNGKTEAAIAAFRNLCRAGQCWEASAALTPSASLMAYEGLCLGAAAKVPLAPAVEKACVDFVQRSAGRGLEAAKKELAAKIEARVCGQRAGGACAKLAVPAAAAAAATGH